MKKPRDHVPKKPMPTMWDADEESWKYSSMKNEKRLSEELRFRLTKGSGNQPWPGSKGDGSDERFMFECKETKGSRLSLGKDVLEKLCREALTVGKDPVLILSMYGLSDPVPQDWVVVPVDVFRNVFEKIE